MNQLSREYTMVIPDYDKEFLDVSIFVGDEVFEFLGDRMMHNRWVRITDMISNLDVAEHIAMDIDGEEVLLFRTI